MISESKSPKNTQINNESHQDVIDLMEKLQQIEKLAQQEQGRWANVDSENSPSSVLPFKKIIEIIKSNHN